MGCIWNASHTTPGQSKPEGRVALWTREPERVETGADAGASHPGPHHDEKRQTVPPAPGEPPRNTLQAYDLHCA